MVCMTPWLDFKAESDIFTQDDNRGIYLGGDVILVTRQAWGMDRPLSIPEWLEFREDVRFTSVLGTDFCLSRS